MGWMCVSWLGVNHFVIVIVIVIVNHVNPSLNG